MSRFLHLRRFVDASLLPTHQQGSINKILSMTTKSKISKVITFLCPSGLMLFAVLRPLFIIKDLKQMPYFFIILFNFIKAAECEHICALELPYNNICPNITRPHRANSKSELVGVSYSKTNF